MFKTKARMISSPKRQFSAAVSLCISGFVIRSDPGIPGALLDFLGITGVPMAGLQLIGAFEILAGSILMFAASGKLRNRSRDPADIPTPKARPFSDAASRPSLSSVR